MADPTTSNKLLLAPTRGSDVGTWDTPVNADWTALDGMLGGVQTIALSSATTILLTVPATGSVAASAGPNQSQNAGLFFSGTLTGNIIVQFSLPGFYIVHNQCTVGTSYIQLAPSSGTGNAIGAPPGQKVHVFFDGTNLDYVNAPYSGSFMDMAVATTPAWMNACTVAPWLICDGSVYTSSIYPALNAILGSTFGGNGITTFGAPDLRARYRIPLDSSPAQGAANRVTAAVSGINGTTIGAAGGNQSYQAHTHGASGSDSGHTHPTPGMVTDALASFLLEGGGADVFGFSQNTGIGYANVSVAVATSGAGASGNIPPGLVFGMTFIKT